VVVAEAGADQLLHQEGFLVGAARRGDAADRADAGFALDAAEAVGDTPDRLLPRRLAPRIADALAHHRLEDAVAMRGVAPGEAALDAGMPVIGAAVLVGDHADDFLAAHLRFEAATHAAIGASGDDGVFRLAGLDHRFFDQRRCRTSLHAGAAGDALGLEKIFAHAWRDDGRKAASLDGQREGALHLLAG